MSLFPDRSGTALLVVDVQRGVVDDAYERDAVVSRIAALVDRARAERVPVVWVQDDDLGRGTPAWEIVDELTPVDEEDRVYKRYGDAFEATDLDEALARLGVDRLVVAGAETDACIRSTIHGAFTRGFDTVLVEDAHTATDKSEWGAPPVADVIRHTNLYWAYHDGPGRTAGTATAAEVALR
ncbi:isochorismatase family protein [Microbacterium sp. GXF7504]